MVMKRISIQELKAHLSAAVAEAEAGGILVVTRHNEPVAQLGPAHPQHVHRRSRLDSGQLRPAVARGTSGRYLEVLADDRGDR